MTDLESYIKIKGVFDFDSTEKEKIYTKLKQAFSEKCKNDSTLSDEYKKHISNLDNINVTINYNRVLEIYFHNLKFKVEYETKESYESTTGYSGTITTDMYGNKKVENLHRNTEWNSYVCKHTPEVSLWSSELSPLILKKGSGATKENSASKYYNKSMDSPNLPKALTRTFDNNITKEYINQVVTNLAKRNGLNSDLQNRIYKYISEVYHDNPKSVTVTEAIDYSLHRIEVSYVPYEFYIYTTFNDKTYSCKYNINLSRSYEYGVVADGEKSEKYNEFKKRCDFYNEQRPNGASALMIISMIYCAFPLVVYYLQDFLSFLPEFWKQYSFPFVFVVYLGSALLGAIPFCYYKYGLKFKPDSTVYNQYLSVTQNNDLIEKQWKKHKSLTFFISLIITIVTCVSITFIWYIK